MRITCSYSFKTDNLIIVYDRFCFPLRETLTDSLNRSGWICNNSDEEIVDVVRRVLATLASKTEVIFYFPFFKILTCYGI